MTYACMRRISRLPRGGRNGGQNCAANEKAFHFFRALAACLPALCLCLSLCAPAVLAAPAEDGGVADLVDILDDAAAETLRGDIAEFSANYPAGFLILTLSPGTYDTLESAAESVYLGGGYGYEDTEDGFALAYDAETRALALCSFGAAKNWVPEEFLRFAEEQTARYEVEHGTFGALYSGFRYIESYLETTPPGTADTAALVIGGVARVGEGSSLPPWYPADRDSFQFYHDESAPRVADSAGLFTAYEAEQMERRLAELRGELGRDIVIYTDRSAYGLGHDICAADFYDYNGYGIGEDREGACLFICMDPNDRGWCCCCTGPVTRGLYTESIANRIDDALYEYMAAGNYAAGVSDWIENFARLYRKGDPFAPDWYPAADEQIVRAHNDQAPRIVDDSGALTGSELQKLTEQASAIASKYGIDVAIHVAPYPNGISRQDFSDKWYQAQGYGYGDGYDGLLLTAFWQPGYYGNCYLTAEGKGADKLSEVNAERLTGFCKELLDEGRVYDALTRYLTQAAHMERTGRVPRSAAYWAVMAVLSALIGSLIGGIGLGGARRKMRTVRTAVDADHYLAVNGIRSLGDRLINTTTTRSYNPPPRPRSSGGGRSSSSGGSSYHSSYHGSSGASHSGSGRKF